MPCHFSAYTHLMQNLNTRSIFNNICYVFDTVGYCFECCCMQNAYLGGVCACASPIEVTVNALCTVLVWSEDGGQHKAYHDVSLSAPFWMSIEGLRMPVFTRVFLDARFQHLKREVRNVRAFYCLRNTINHPFNLPVDESCCHMSSTT